MPSDPLPAYVRAIRAVLARKSSHRSSGGDCIGVDFPRALSRTRTALPRPGPPSQVPPVSRVAPDPRSGGVVRTYGTSELDQNEPRPVDWTSEAVTGLVRTLQRRATADRGVAPVVAAMQQAFSAITRDRGIIAPVTPFQDRERMGSARAGSSGRSGGKIP